MAKFSALRNVFNIVLILIVFFFGIGVAKDYTSTDWMIWLTGFLLAGFAAYGLYRERGVEPAKPARADLSVPVKEPGPLTKEPGRYRFIFTHDEAVLDAIESTIARHPRVKEVFQDSGYWYSNGETGPEWFSMHVICDAKDSEELQAFVSKTLEEAGHKGGVRFMGSYN